MPEQEPNEQAGPDASTDEDPSKSDRVRRSRPRTLTSEQRRLLGKPRPLHERVEAEKEIDAPAPADEATVPPARQRRETREPQTPAAKEHSGEELSERKPESEERESAPALQSEDRMINRRARSKCNTQFLSSARSSLSV